VRAVADVNVSLAVGALVSWLLAEILGAYMLKNWVTSGAARLRKTRPDGMSLPVLLAHAGLNLTGMLCWVAFVATRSGIAAWLAILFLVPAIGLGVSTVSVWTPYPVSRDGPDAGADAGGGPADWSSAGPGGHRDWGQSAIPDEVLARAMEDEAVARKLTEDLLVRNLAYEARTDRRMRLDPRAIVPLMHGVLAIVTFLLATLAAISAS
jgi:hypothetical protein